MSENKLTLYPLLIDSHSLWIIGMIMIDLGLVALKEKHLVLM